MQVVTELSLEYQHRIRDIRNQKSVRNVMYTDHEITADEHASWLDRLKSDSNQIVFAVIDLDMGPIGVVSVNAIDLRHAKADWAFYLSASERGGLGAALEFTLLKFAFNELKLKKLNCEVLDSNPSVIRMHKKFGFQEEGIRRSNIEKEGRRIDVHLLGITDYEFFQKCADIYTNYRATLDKFEIVMHWEKSNSRVI